jgi:tetratricopeptide (TPR) repeat protein
VSFLVVFLPVSCAKQNSEKLILEDARPEENTFPDFPAIIIENDYDFLMHFSRGTRYFDEQQYDAAAAEYDKAFNCIAVFSPGYKEDNAPFERTINKRAFYEGIIEKFERLIRYTGNNHNIFNFYGYFFRGYAYSYIGKDIYAVPDFIEAIIIDSSKTDVYYHRAWAYYFIDEYEKSRADWNIVSGREPDKGERLLWLNNMLKGK